MGFPSYICISVNEQLIHGIATNYILKKDDLVTFDIGVKYDDHFCDSAFSINLNPANTKNQAILDATKECLDESIKLAVAGNKTGDLGNKIEEVAQKHGYEVIKDYGGHGCGNKIHEDPFIMCYGKKNTGIKLVPGMVICIEPMLLTGTDKYYIDPKNN
jgi:methionyl aminopeptidase